MSIQKKELLKVVESNGLEKATGGAIINGFLPFLENVAEWEKKAKALIVKSVDEKDLMTQAREGRLALKKIRTTANNKRKELKEDSVRYGKAVQGIYNIIDFKIRPLEEHLEKQEKFIQIKEAEQKEKIRQERFDRLAPLQKWAPTIYDLTTLSEQDFEKLINGAKASKKWEEDEAEKEAKAIVEKAAKEALHNKRVHLTSLLSAFIPKYEDTDLSNLTEDQFMELVDAAKIKRSEHQAEQARIKAENEKLKAEAEDKEKKAAKEKAAAEKKAKEDKAKSDKILKEKEAQAAAEKEKRENLEKKIAEEKRAFEQKAEELNAKLKAEAEAKAAAPDKEKIELLLHKFEEIKMPTVKTKKATESINKIDKKKQEFCSFIRSELANY